MKSFLINLLDRIPYVRRLNEQVATLSGQVKNQGLFPAGNYFSPIPSPEEVEEHLGIIQSRGVELPDIKLNEDGQFRLLQEYAEFYDSMPFPEQKQGNLRYYFANSWFSYADAIFLYSFLRKFKPRRIIEVGSGFSSAVILDTVDQFFDQPTKITFIEPYPDRLNSLLTPQDQGRVEVIINKFQRTPIDVLTSLQSGDLLFIDSTHVVKFGSDVQYLMFEVLPRLCPGVFVHFHDVFFPFEYPPAWLIEGRFWNEDYFLRAFLAYNNQWSITFFNTFVAHTFQDFLQKKMPLCLMNPGGSLYIQKSGG